MFHPREIRGGLGGPLNDARMQLLFRLSALFGEGHGGQHFKERAALFVQRGAAKDNPLWLDDFLVNAVIGNMGNRDLQFPDISGVADI